MLTLRAAIAASALLFAAAPHLTAQQVWNDERTMQLVEAATLRRSLQLSDTALRTYTARARGTLTFLAQLGDGAFSRPIVVRSDQLQLEVYWSAPNRSKQTIVGRRDTLLLPNDMQYHRDHLGIIQNNFPDIIRLGDGDEVMDVVHPLSAAGAGTYDYAIADSLLIRGSGVDLDVMMISVRPRDASRPAAVGAVYIDRATASVVRMTFSFTRAALRDRQLEDVSVILENGLVDGRFWLPRRQEIEVRRSASWMDFPAKGIIRGRWEICCIVTNQGMTDLIFRGPEIVEAGTREQLRRHPAVQGDILASLPEDARALEAEEVRAVQDEARRLVAESALRRARSSNIAARRISDFVRSDRVEGLALGAGVSQRFGGGVSTSVVGRYGTADFRWKGRGTITWQRASGLSIAAAGYDDWQQLGDVVETSGLRNSLASQEFGSDYTQPIGAVGGSLRVQWAPPERGRVWMEFARQDERALTGNRLVPAQGDFEPTFPALELTRQSVTLGSERAMGVWRVGAYATASEWTPRDGSASGRALRTSVDAEAAWPLSARTQVRTRLTAAALSRGAVPPQDGVLFGGPVSGPGYNFHSLVGRTGVSQRIELQQRIPFVPINLGRFGRVPATLVIAPFVHGVWLDQPVAGNSGWHPSVGLGTIGFFDLVRMDVARGLRDGRWTFSMDVSRTLWPVL